MSDSSSTYTAKDWDEVRSSFATSIMVDTSLSSLAENLDGPAWPIKGADETPAAYIDLGYDEMVEMLALKGYPDHAGRLIAILKETLAFDDPFGEMVEQAEAGTELDNELLKNMHRLGLPEDFPITLTALDADTLEFCRLEGLDTLGKFARFAQGMSQNVIVGGDFRKLLNALSHVDEKTLAAVLPFRPGSKGLHLLECLAQSSPDQAARLQEAYGRFSDELQGLQSAIDTGGDLSRQLMVLGDPEAEQRVMAILRKVLKGLAPAPEKKTGLFGAISRLFGK